MSKYVDLKQIIKTVLEQRKKINPTHKYKIEQLVPQEELKKYSQTKQLVASVESELIITMCGYCYSAKVNDQWIPESNYTRLLRTVYSQVSFGVCEKHREHFISCMLEGSPSQLLPAEGSYQGDTSET